MIRRPSPRRAAVPAGPGQLAGAGFHDGAVLPLAVGLELLRLMLRGEGGWCRLEAAGRFSVDVGWDLYVYVGSAEPCAPALERTRELGLFPERLDRSPYASGYDEPGTQRPADAEFWALVELTIPPGGALLLEEGYVHNACRWYRVTRAGLSAVRAGLAPRARLTVWPDFLSGDVEAVLRAVLAQEDTTDELVREDSCDGRISSFDPGGLPEAQLRELLTGVRAAALLPVTVDDRHPLFTAVRPDPDGVLRARWRTDPTPSDLEWSAAHDARTRAPR
ncbi:hypothetical protein P3T37_006241 [Kitasatospora sp. MAA4]|uniref:RNA-binding protein n=1 Tax=Kitasatospora sp. MAA4 TaxID=3035093 RepID=UPI0024770CA9|nr:RNA-binding protein [Kitasatospora sp. MAA4]MDH6136810.1 hypothetical protein [Kitasatospora sp. MAA4]